MSTPSHPAETFHCPLCSGNNFRRSRFTWQDIARMLMLEIPIRCQDCGERTTVALPKALKALSLSAKRKSKLQY